MKKNVNAFSLIEVVISLGVLSFAMIGLMGLIPVALGTLRQSITVNTETEIAQTLLGEAHVMDFGEIITPSSPYVADFPRHYNDEAERVAPGAPNSIYQVTLQISTCRLPGVPTDNPDSPARLLVFQISNLRQPDDPESFSVWVVDNGR